MRLDKLITKSFLFIPLNHHLLIDIYLSIKKVCLQSSNFFLGRIKPKLSIDALSKIAYVGDTKNFVCSVIDGFPKPIIFWRTASGYRVPRSYVKETADGKVVLVFKRVFKVLGGRYTCVGINAAGKTELTAKLDVKGKLA